MLTSAVPEYFFLGKGIKIRLRDQKRNINLQADIIFLLKTQEKLVKISMIILLQSVEITIPKHLASKIVCSHLPSEALLQNFLVNI